MEPTRTRKRVQGQPIGQRFAYLPYSVMESQAYVGLSPRAKALLMEFAFLYRGKNNGNLSAAPSDMAKRGWRSRANLVAALRELEAAGFICVTRQGHKPRVCSLYAITWRHYDYEKGKNEMTPTAFPKHQYQVISGGLRCPPADIKDPIQDHEWTSEPAVMSTGGLMEAISGDS